MVKRNTCYKATLRLTASESKTAKNSKDVIKAKNLGVYGCRLAYQPVAFFELILFSAKLQVCFLQPPELCTVQERGTIKRRRKMKKKKKKNLHQSKISTLDYSKLLS